VIEVTGVTKRYGSTTAVHDLNFTVRPGAVTGFLGPNGSGKSTTMRLILGLDAPDSGRALVSGKPYRDHLAPLNEWFIPGARPTTTCSHSPTPTGSRAPVSPS
jgi:ABC-2 type transport system ATP-binding protein